MKKELHDNFLRFPNPNVLVSEGGFACVEQCERTVEPVFAESTLQHCACHAAATHAVLGFCLVLLFLDVLYSQLPHHLHFQLLSNLVRCHLVAHSKIICYVRCRL